MRDAVVLMAQNYIVKIVQYKGQLQVKLRKQLQIFQKYLFRYINIIANITFNISEIKINKTRIIF